MDKYTVDLDQVLNDFEYSELTDQQSKNASERPQNSTTFQPTPITKHSINNVFHSLNEYLNNEISSNSGKIELQVENLGFDQPNVGKNDNNLVDNVKEPYSQVEEARYHVKTGLEVSKNEAENSNNSTFESLGQNERLLKLKNEPQNAEVSEKVQDNYEHEKDSNAVAYMQLDQSQGRDENLCDEPYHQDLMSNHLEYNENPSSIKPENLGVSQENHIECDPPNRSNEDPKKTDNKDFSLLDMENIEPEVMLELIFTDNNIKGEIEDVNNGMQCDKPIENKADNKLDNEQTNFEEKTRFFNANECKKEYIEDDTVNNSENNEAKDFLGGITEYTSNMIDSDDVNVLENVENFVIEPSESIYVLGTDSLQDNNSLNTHERTGAHCEESNVSEKVENGLKLDNSEELSIENDEEIQKNISHKGEPIDNESTPRGNVTCEEEPSTNNDAEQKRQSLLIETTTYSVEDNSSDSNKDNNNTDQQVVVGFSADLDIDENELNKMLEDLEIEERSGLDGDLAVANNLNKTEGESVEDHEVKEEEINIENMGINGLNSDGSAIESRNEMSHIDNGQIEAPSSNSEPKCDSSKQISSEQSKEVKDSDRRLKESKENIGTQLIECLEIEKPTKSKKGSSKNTEKLENTKKENTGTTETLQGGSNIAKQYTGAVETASDQPLDQLDRTTATLIEKQQSQDSVTRPHDLPLNNELKEENVKRKIDLIGSPGSTPYNNVYVSKSIDPKTTQDTDSDYTSSASPTFSDCSTESTSTASTVSVEDYPKDSDGATNVATKNSGHKNRTSGKSGKNRDIGQGAQGDGDTEASKEDGSVQENSEAIEGAAELPSSIEPNAADISESGEGDSQERTSQRPETFLDKSWLGKEAPLWIPDSDAASCLHCDMKFTVLKRRHHCRACGLVLCSKCCNLKLRLEYLDTEARVCTKCHNILNKDSNNPSESGQNTSDAGDSPAFRPNPNNPLEYCSTVSPLQQMGPEGVPPPSVMVPVGVLKRKGSNKKSNKSVMFCDGIAPGSDLTHLDQDFNYHSGTKTQKSPEKVPEEVKKKDEIPPVVQPVKSSRNMPKIDQDTGCFIPKSETSLPPTVCVNKTDILYSECSNSPSVVEMLKNEALVFAINQNLVVQVKVINMSCCINKQAWCFSTDGLINVGSDEIVYLIEYIDEESFVPKDVFFHINNVYLDAVKGTSVKELGLSLHNTSNFLDSKNHAGFVYLRSTFQCLENVLKPKEPYLIGILIHRWETPWAKLFPLRLILRLGAEYRYYPSPLISTRHRDSVFVEIGHTIINLLADFRNFTYTLPQIRGLIIHMEDKNTTITIPKNRYDQVMKSINNSSEHILAFAGNFSSEADSHLVCIQDTQGHENCYTTHAINIHNQPRKITGASFIVFNGSLKSSSGLTAKSNIVEDGLMIQIPSEHMDKVRENLRNMKNHTIACGCINASSDETVNIVWGGNDVDFNAGVQSPVDLSDMKGVPSIRVHNGKDHCCNTRLIRWTEVFILQSGEENPKNQDPVDISKVSESIAKACCTALVKYLDLLVSNSCQKIGIRATLHVENVSYSAGSNGLKLPPIYMRSLDNELVPVLHRITSNNLGDNAIVVELIFRILNA